MYQQRGSQYLSREGHWDVHDYFSDMQKRQLCRFEDYWRKLSKFDPKDKITLSTILSYIAKQLPDHEVGSQRQREIGKFIKDNFSVWENKTLASLRYYDSRALAASVWSIAKMGAHPSQKFMHEWYLQATKKASSKNINTTFNERDFANSLASLATIQSQNPELQLDYIYHDIREHLDVEDLEPIIGEAQVYYADLYFRGESNIEEPDQTLAKDYIPPPPFSEIKLAQIFKRAGYTVYKSDPSPIPGMRDAIDFTVEDEEGNKVHFECDGPSHYLNPEAKSIKNLKYNMATRFLSALRTRQAPDAHIVRVNYKYQDTLEAKNRKLQKAFCDAVFKSALEKGSGCYYVNADSNNLLIDMVPKAANENTEATSSASAPSVRPPLYANGNGGLPGRHAHPHSRSHGNHPG